MLGTINAVSYAALATIAKNNLGDFVVLLVPHKEKKKFENYLPCKFLCKFAGLVGSVFSWLAIIS